MYFNQDPVLNAGGGGIPAEFGGVLRRRAPRTPASARTSRRTPCRCTSRRGSRTRRPPKAAASARPRRTRSRRSGRWRAQFGISFDDRAPARRRVVPVESERHAAVGHARQRPVPRQSRGRGRRPARQGARRHVRAAAVLALADAGHLSARLQRDPELERSRRREGGDWRAADRAEAGISNEECRM